MMNRDMANHDRANRRMTGLDRAMKLIERIPTFSQMAEDMRMEKNMGERPSPLKAPHSKHSKVPHLLDGSMENKRRGF